MAKISKQEFIERISKISSAKSLQGKTYVSIHVDGSVCTGIRKSTGKSFKVNLDKVYEVYIENEEINTAVLKPYVDRNQSPAFAILKETGIV